MRYEDHFRLAHELKKNINEIMGWNGPMTHRQFLCWNEWLDINSMNEPSRTDYYLMQIAAEQRRSWSKHTSKIKTDTFKIKWSRGNGQPLTEEQKRSKLSEMKQRWLSRMTAGVKVLNASDGVKEFIPPAVKRRQEIEKARQKQLAAKRARTSITTKPSTSLQDVNASKDVKDTSNSKDVNNGNRTRGVSSKDDGRRIPLRSNVRRGNKPDSNTK